MMKKLMFIFGILALLLLSACDFTFTSFSTPPHVEQGLYQVNFTATSNISESSSTGWFVVQIPNGWNQTGGNCTWDGGSTTTQFNLIENFMIPNSTNAVGFCGNKSGYFYTQIITNSNMPSPANVTCTGFINATTNGSFFIDYYIGNDWSDNDPIIWTDSQCNQSITVGCLPDWTCSGYGTCNTSDFAPCNSATDNNACGWNYTGDYSEFSPQACDYCDDDLDLLSLGYCDTGTGIRPDSYTDLNFATCCNVTNTIPSDCPFGNVSEFGIVNESCSSQYISGYVVSDLTEVTIDFLVLFLIGIVSLAGVIGLVFVFRWAKKQVK